MEEERPKQVSFQPLARCRHVERVCAGKYETVASRGMVERQLLSDGAAMRVAEHSGRVDTQMIEQKQ